MSSRRILVTGGSGFIGTHLVEAIIASGDIVANLDIAPPKLQAMEPHWHQIDLFNLEQVKRLVSKFRPDCIINLAAVADLSMSLEEMRLNFIGVENLVVAAGAVQPHPRLVHVSTQLVAEAGYSPAGPRDYKPYTEYGQSKAMSEEVLWTQGQRLTWMIARPTNVWGPWHPSFALSTWKYLRRRWYMLPTGSKPIRSYGYVKNVAAQLLAAAKTDADLIDRGIFYVGDEPIPAADWLDGFSRLLTGRATRRIPGALLVLLALTGEVMKKLRIPAPFDQGRLYRITTDYQVPMAPTFQILGRGPASLEEGIAETVAWLHQSFPDEFCRS